MKPTDFLLLQISVPVAGLDALKVAAQLGLKNFPLAFSLHRLAYQAEQGFAYLYFALPPDSACDEATRSALQALWNKAHPALIATAVARLQRVFNAVGASQGASPIAHYVVEADAEAGWLAEIESWYNTEHMPGLAAVPGCIHAMRLHNHDADFGADATGNAKHFNGWPYSFACYDLTTPSTLNRAEWLAVRHTAWSDKARPHFRNTKRTMMQVVA